MFMKIGVESRRAKVKGQRAKIRARGKEQNLKLTIIVRHLGEKKDM